MNQGPFRHDRMRKQSPLLAISASVLFVALLLAVMVYFDVHEQLLQLLRWVDTKGAWSALLFILIMAAVVVLVLPGVLLTTGAGFVFGVVEGSIYVVIGTTLGATFAFLIARYLFGQRARSFVISRAKLRLLSDELTPQGWKIVLLTRLIPFFPGKLSNYFFGLTSFSLPGFVAGSLLGFVPFSIHNVYLGSIAVDISAQAVGSLDRSPLGWVVYAAGFLATVIAVIYFNHLARRALKKYMSHGSGEEKSF
ncbi:MAG: TVP38/TMEM64 family protein [Desulfuromonadales bacterium]|nr:TVP38/TMEM64 family protein [Desulfuromonadales bacterium]